MLKGLRDNIYIIPLPDPTVTASGLIIEQGQQRIDQGIIKYRGPEVRGLRVGQHVLFGGWDGDQIVTEDDGLLYVMSEDSVKAIVADDQPLYLFTKEKLDQLIGEAERLVALRYSAADGELDTRPLTYFQEKLSSLIHDNFYNELIF